MELSKAKALAEQIVWGLAPYCERIEIAGSIRRNCPEVGDIEIVCIPKQLEHILAALPDSAKAKLEGKPVAEFVRLVNQWKKVKGEPSGRYTQRILPEGIKVDIFMPRKDNWGLIFAIRTGSANFSQFYLAGGWTDRGWKCVEGRLTDGKGKVIDVYEEQQLFDLIQRPFVHPEKRN